MTSWRIALGAALVVLWATPTAWAQTPAAFREHLRAWSGEAEALLSAQPRDGALRAALRNWLEAQADSLQAVPHALVGPAQPVKLRGSAAFVLDRANEHRAALSADEFEGLMNLADRMADHCHAAYGQTQNPCTNADHWILKGLITLARARQPGADAAQALAPMLRWLHASLTPPPGSRKTAQDMPEVVCAYWWNSLRGPLSGERFLPGHAQAEQAFFDAYLALVPPMLEACRSIVSTQAWRAAPALEQWAAAIETRSAALGRDPAADAASVRAAAQSARRQLDEARR